VHMALFSGIKVHKHESDCPANLDQPESSVADPDPGSGAFLTHGSGIRDG